QRRLRIDAGGAGKAELEVGDGRVAAIGQLDAIAKRLSRSGWGPGGGEGERHDNILEKRKIDVSGHCRSSNPRRGVRRATRSNWTMPKEGGNRGAWHQSPNGWASSPSRLTT